MRLLRTATHAAVATSVHGKVSRRQQAQWAQQTAAAPAAAAAAPTPEPAAAPAAPANDMGAKLEQLKQLGELRDAGILTPEEFEAKKAVILG
ncbi:SHOCT domain-containing protein [Microcella sp.]|uniref:SHOCT domain-containing protein n=1 Tax=Microcella sp. TaxID=1913979 RepID=UPI003F6F395C